MKRASHCIAYIWLIHRVRAAFRAKYMPQLDDYVYRSSALAFPSDVETESMVG